jgi:hypothetical protein
MGAYMQLKELEKLGPKMKGIGELEGLSFYSVCAH